MRANNSGRHWRLWLLLAPAGFILTGLGLSLTIEAAYIKNHSSGNFWTWVLLGTLGLSIFNAGLALIGDAVKHRMFYERYQEKELD